MFNFQAIFFGDFFFRYGHTIINAVLSLTRSHHKLLRKPSTINECKLHFNYHRKVKIKVTKTKKTFWKKAESLAKFLFGHSLQSHHCLQFLDCSYQLPLCGWSFFILGRNENINSKINKRTVCCELRNLSRKTVTERRNLYLSKWRPTRLPSTTRTK